MFERIIRFCIEQRWLVMLAVLGMAGLGIYNYGRLPVDAVVDISSVQAVINTEAPGYSPLETEQRITYPIETVMAGLPGLEQTRSLSRYGLSQVTVIFKDGTDIYFARQLVNQRLQEARDRLPAGVTPSMGPISTGLGEIYLWTVEASDGAKKPDGTAYTSTDLREIQDWVIKPQLRNVKGVTDINSIGGFEKQYVVAPNLERLGAHGLSLADVVAALEKNNANLGAGYIERRGEQYLVRAPGQVKSMDDIGDIIIGTAAGQPIRVRDVAKVELGRELRTGAATENGQEVVLGTVFMLMGENSRTVSRAVDRQMAAINKTLPAGVKAITVYDRTVLVDKAVWTVQKNLLEGAVLVIAVLFVFLGNIRAAFITAMVIPLAMLFTFSGMVSYGISANLMSLGALDFGIIVDGAVVIIENAVRRLAHAQAHRGRPLSRSERFHEVFAAAREARRPLLFGQLIIMVVYVPILALTGVEGKMFHPMAYTVLLALFGAMLLSVTFVPAAVALFIGDKVAETESGLMAWAKRRYQPALKSALGNAPVVLTFAAVAVAFSVVVASRLGSEFVPNLNEGDFAIQALRIPGTSLTQSVEMQKQLEATLKAKFPEIERIFARTGTAEIAADPMPPNVSDGYIMLKPVDQWPEPRKTRDQLLAAIRDAAAGVPGNNYEFSQPIQLRFNELISGVRSDVAVKLFGDDNEVLNRTATQIAAALQSVPGATEVKVEQTTGLPMLSVNIDRAKATRWPEHERGSGSGRHGHRRTRGRHALPGRPPLRHPGSLARGRASGRRGPASPSDCVAQGHGADLVRPARRGGIARPVARAQPGVARGREAPRRRQRKRDGARPRLVRRRCPRCVVGGQDSCRVLGRLGRNVRATRVGIEAPPGGRAAGAADGLRPAVHDVRQPEGRSAGLHRHSVRAHWRRARAVDARHPDVDLGGGRFHRTLRRRRAERSRHAVVHPQPA